MQMIKPGKDACYCAPLASSANGALVVVGIFNTAHNVHTRFQFACVLEREYYNFEGRQNRDEFARMDTSFSLQMFARST